MQAPLMFTGNVMYTGDSIIHDRQEAAKPKQALLLFQLYLLELPQATCASATLQSQHMIVLHHTECSVCP